MKFSWPKQSILNLFQETNLKGEVKIELNSNYEAEQFRFALYHFRDRTKIGKEFKSFRISVKETKLTIYKPIMVEFKRLEKELTSKQPDRKEF